jgi:hypothetical protein
VHDRQVVPRCVSTLMGAYSLHMLMDSLDKCDSDRWRAGRTGQFGASAQLCVATFALLRRL